MNVEAPVLVDGSVMEGGGQILRVSVACAAIRKIPVCIKNIRAGRSKPGLSNQHLAGIHLCAQLSTAKLSDCRLGSTQLLIAPSGVKGGTYEADAKTAGSISLLLQVAIPILAFADTNSGNDSVLNLKGGTDAKFAPPIDYMSEITFHYFSQMGIHCTLDLLRRGFYPQGGGNVKVCVQSIRSPLSPLSLTDAGALNRITGYTFVAGRVPVRVAEEMKRECITHCAQFFPSIPVHIRSFRETDDRCSGNASAFMFVAHTLNGCRLAVSGIGDPRGPSPASLVRNAVDKLARMVYAGACCDDNMQDQLILLMALAAGRSEIKTGPLTLHTQTAIYVTELLLPVKYLVQELDDGTVIIACDGIGQPPPKA